MNTKFLTGRISRGGYFASIAGTLLLIQIVNSIYGLLPPYKIFFILEYTILNPMIQIGIWAILFIILSIKRLHDMNKSGLWFFLPVGFVALVTIPAEVLGGFIVLPAIMFTVILMSIKKGTVGPNKYGEDPVYRKAPVGPSEK